jgi:hypothetical protein
MNRLLLGVICQGRWLLKAEASITVVVCQKLVTGLELFLYTKLVPHQLSFTINDHIKGEKLASC